MEQILPVLEGELRRFRRHSAWLAGRHPALARELVIPAAPDAHVDRLVQGVALLNARTALALQRARWQEDEHLLDSHFPGHLRPFPECRIGPGGGAARVAVLAARYCPGHAAMVELELELDPASGASCADVFIDGDTAFSAALRDVLLGGIAGAGDCPSRRRPFEPAGLDPSEALLPREPGADPGLALLREYFTFPARFNIVRLDLAQFPASGRWTIRLPAPGAAPEARLLAALRADHLRPGWTARAKLHRTAAAPVVQDGRHHEYLIATPPDEEIFSIDRVRINGQESKSGWIARRALNAAPGNEWRIAFHGAGAWRAFGSVVSIDVTCCERSKVLARAPRGPGCRWQLNSLLALDKMPRDANALREIMATQAIGNSATAHAIIDSVLGLEVRPVTIRIGRAAPCIGSEIMLQVDESAFAGSGLLLFAQVMDRFFGECTQINTFTRLVLASAKTGEELIRCKARSSSTLLE